MMIGASKIGSATRRIDSWKVERLPIRAMNCLGIVSRDSGQTRVPAPPHMMTGCICFVIAASPRASAGLADSPRAGGNTSFVTKSTTHFRDGQGSHEATMSLRNGCRLARGPLDVDVGVASLRAGHRRALLECRQRVADRGAPEALHFHADFDSVGVRQTREKSAIALGHKTDDRTGAGIQQAGLDEDLIYRRVEKLIIGDVVQVAVDVVVPPTRRHPDESRESGAAERRFTLARGPVGSVLAQPSLPEN